MRDGDQQRESERERERVAGDAHLHASSPLKQEYSERRERWDNSLLISLRREWMLEKRVDA